MEKLKIKYKLCSCGCGRKVYPSFNSTIIPKLHPFCQAKQNNKKNSHKQEPVKSSIKTNSRSLLNKKTNIDQLLDNAWSKLTKLIAGYKCEVCGSPDNLTSHHIIYRRHKNLRWIAENGICLCDKHHTISKKFSAHETPEKFIEWYGKEEYDELKLLSNVMPGKFTYEEKLVILKVLRNEIKQLEAV